MSRWGVIGGHVGWLLVALVLCAVQGIDDQSDLDVIVALQLGGITTGLIGALVVIGASEHRPPMLRVQHPDSRTSS